MSFFAALTLVLSSSRLSAQELELKPAPAPYVTAHAAPLEATEKLDTEADDHTRWHVEFNGVKGDRVPAFLYLPKAKDKAPPAPTLLLQYGIGGNKKTDYIVQIGKQFAAAGFAVLTIDVPGVGERKKKGEKSFGVLDVLMGGEKMMHYCGDYSRAIDFLVTRKEVDKDRIGYVGLSWGAITGITFVAYEPRIKAMCSMVGGGNFLGGYTPKAAEKAAAEGSKSSDPVFHVGRIAPRPLLFVNVTKDQLIFKPWADSLHKAAGTGAKVVWLETDHYFSGVDHAAVCRDVIDFLDKGLTTAKRDKGEK